MLIPSPLPAVTVGNNYVPPLHALPTLNMGSSGGEVTASSLVLALARGGEFVLRKSSALDVGRVRMRLEGMLTYATLCALLTNGCLRLYSSIQAPAKGTNVMSRRTQIASDAFFLCVVLSVLMGSYTTIVFGLISLFSKTALGRGYDTQFLEFWAATASLRESGFKSFICSLVCFELAFILSLTLRFQGRRRIVFGLLAFAISVHSFSKWSTILRLASQLLFTLHAEVQY